MFDLWLRSRSLNQANQRILKALEAIRIFVLINTGTTNCPTANLLMQKRIARIALTLIASIAIVGRGREALEDQEEVHLLTKPACIVAAGVTAHVRAETDAATAEKNTKNAPILKTLDSHKFMLEDFRTTSTKRICADIFLILDQSRRS